MQSLLYGAAYGRFTSKQDTPHVILGCRANRRFEGACVLLASEPGVVFQGICQQD